MTNQTCLHCFISGKVQGVWYRASTKEEAGKLGVTGWVRNLPDGRVEVMICGEQSKVETLYAWLRQGPPRANVTEVAREELPWREYVEFEAL